MTAGDIHRKQAAHAQTLARDISALAVELGALDRFLTSLSTGISRLIQGTATGEDRRLQNTLHDALATSRTAVQQFQGASKAATTASARLLERAQAADRAEQEANARAAAERSRNH